MSRWALICNACAKGREIKCIGLSWRADSIPRSCAACEAPLAEPVPYEPTQFGGMLKDRFYVAGNPVFREEVAEIKAKVYERRSVSR